MTELTAEQQAVLGIPNETAQQEEAETKEVTAETAQQEMPNEGAEAPAAILEGAQDGQDQQAEEELLDEELPDAPADEEQPTAETPVVKAEEVVVKAKIDEFTSQTARNALLSIADYVKNMAPRKPVTDQQVCVNQVALYRAIQNTINKCEADFAETFAAILADFHAHANGVFHETRVFRGFDEIQLPTNDRTAFMRLLNMIKLLANPASRKIALKQIDLEASLQYGVTEQGKNKVLAFFGK